MLHLLSDYDLSLICTSECDDEYFKCVSTCGSSDCFMDCNRATVICIEGKYAAYCMVTGPSPVSDSIQIISCLKSLSIKDVHVIRIALMVVKDATIQSASAM